MHHRWRATRTPSCATAERETVRPNGVSGLTRRCGCRGRSCDDRDQESELDAEEVTMTTSRGEVEQAAVRELVKAARARGEDLTGPRRAAQGDRRHRPGDSAERRADRAPRSRETPGTHNRVRQHPQRHPPEDGAYRATGGVTIAVGRRDRAGTLTGTFEPVIVKKRQRRLSDVDAVRSAYSPRD